MFPLYRQLYEGALRKNARIPTLHQDAARISGELGIAESRARSTFEYARAQSTQLDAYFQQVLAQHAAEAARLVAMLPVAATGGWHDPAWAAWDASMVLEEPLLRIGSIRDQRANPEMTVPAFAPFIGQARTIIIQCDAQSSARALALMHALIVRTALMLPHQTRYTLLDPAGHGIAFPMRRYLPHVRESSSDVRRDLDNVIVDIQRIITTYLDASTRSFELIPREMRINERYQFVCAADFPNQYDRRAIESLQSISNTGHAAGTYVFIHHNTSVEMPRDIALTDFKNAWTIDVRNAAFPHALPTTVHLDDAPPAAVQDRLFAVLASAKPPERAIDFDATVGVPETQWWSEDATRIVQTPVGARGGGDSLNLWFGVNGEGQPCAHGMLGAMTGSGKSNLYHVLILGLALRYSPSELRMYLIDGKDGVEFQPYRQLPHAEVVSLRSSPELSRSVLAELLDEKERRNATFSRHGVNDFASYRQAGQPDGVMPRILLLVDEYQELFDGDRDGVASAQLLQLAQQGRSAGIHMLLASQRFGASGMLRQTEVFGNFHLRMAMQMTTADIQALTEFGRVGKALILTCDLPGKIVVNDHSGEDAANKAGKVAYLPGPRRDELLLHLRDRAATLLPSGLPRRVIFDGRQQPKLLDNPDFAGLLMGGVWLDDAALAKLGRSLDVPDWFAAEHPRALWLGQQFSVRGQAAVVLRRRAGEHALVVGANNAVRYGMLAAALAGLAVTERPETAVFVVFDRSIPGADWHGLLGHTASAILQRAGYRVTFAAEQADIERTLESLTEELARRRALSEAERMQQPTVYVVFTELDRVDALRRNPDSYGSGAVTPQGMHLGQIITDGPSLGVHLIMSFASVRALAQVIDERRGLEQFHHRIALQMSEDESHTFVRGRRAAQLQDDGPRPVCALYLDLERNQVTRFKPYTYDPAVQAKGETLVDELEQVGARLSARRAPV